MQGLISSSLSLVDNLMIGSLGEAELAAAGIATQLYFVHWMCMFGFTSGSSTFMAQFWGSRDLDNIKRTIGFATAVCFAVSVLFFVAAVFCPRTVMRMFTDNRQLIDLGTGYIRTAAPTFLTISIAVPFSTALRATQQTKLPLYIGIGVFTTNTLLNYVFIFGNFGAPKLGVTGAALATLMARCLEVGLVCYFVFAKKNIISGHFREYFRWNRELVVRILRNAIPTTLNETLWGLGTALFAAAYARIGVTAYAAVQAGNVINNLFTMAGFSIGDATLILVGEKLGQGKLDYAYALAGKLLKTDIAFGVISGGLLILCSRSILSLYSLSEEGMKYAFYILVIYGLFMWMTAFNGTMITGVLRCGGDAFFGMASEMGTMYLYAVPAAFFAALVLNVPIHVAVLMVKCEDIIKMLILGRRYFSKKWAKNVIHGI